MLTHFPHTGQQKQGVKSETWVVRTRLRPISFVQSISDNIDFIVGGHLNLGEKPNGSNWQNPNIQSEFGRLANFYYTELKYYF